ncbi:MAG TPA: hypothetical protein PLV93_00040 [Microthrixaceae bacterium]|nr:hypothetical protein [Microthrixaceae bacterium]HNI33749.1 hypothetical protein [Microthrixaceae bacterium]
MTSGDDVDLWAEVVGQDEIVSRLRAATADPTHAYLFVGPPGVGTMAAARAFAADIVSRGAAPDEAVRHRRLASTGHHPSIIVVERVGASILAPQAREIVRQAHMRPPEGDVQVLVLTEFHLVTTAAPILLKSIEEPPDGTVFVVLADEVTPDLVTIASRCVRFEFPHLSAAVIEARLRADGVAADVAAASAVSAGGDLSRARLLATDQQVIDRRNFWFTLPDRLDGSGAAVARAASEVMARADEVLAPLGVLQEAELAELTEQAERSGLRKAVLKDVEARHNRERRRIRTDELRAGLAALMDAYRERAVDHPDDFVEAARLVGELTDNLQYNPNEELALQSLFASLPAMPGR